MKLQREKSKVVNEKMSIMEDTELKIFSEKDEEPQKQIEEIDKKRKEEFEALQRENNKPSGRISDMGNIPVC